MVGQRVEAKFQALRGGKDWYPGCITKVYPTGAYAVDYDDGDRESSVKPHFIRPLIPASMDSAFSGAEGASPEMVAQELLARSHDEPRPHEALRCALAVGRIPEPVPPMLSF